MKTSLLLVLGLLCLAAAKPHNEGKRNHPAKRTREHKLTNRMEHDHHRREHGPPHSKAEAHHGKKAAARRPSTPAAASAAASAPQGQREKDLHLQHLTELNIEKKHDDKQWVRDATTAGKHHLLTNRVPSGDNTHLLTNRTPQVPSSSSSSSSSTSSTSSSSSPAPSSTTPGSPNNSDNNNNNNNTKAKVDGIPMESESLIHVTPRPSKAHKVNKPLHRPASPAMAQLSTPAQPGAPANKGKAHKPPKKYSAKKHGWKKSMRKEKSKDKVKEKRERREKRNKALHRAMAARQL